jgi:hypothetical protein
MPRFVLLLHDHPHVHWDLMLQAGDVLWTWRLAAPPDRRERVEATRIGDHRVHYLDYEGPVSGNRGQVRREDHGHYTVLASSAGALRLRVQGERLVGVLELLHVEADRWEAVLRPELP